MELQQFVAETLRQIVAGIADAQAAVADTGGSINPSEMSLGKNVFAQSKYHHETLATTETVSFDVALTIEEGSGTKGGIGVFVGAIGVGSQGQSDSRSTSLSRVTFSVPVIFPTMKPHR